MNRELIHEDIHEYHQSARDRRLEKMERKRTNGDHEDFYLSDDDEGYNEEEE